MLTRRACLSLSAGLAATGLLGQVQAQEPSLSQLAKAKGLHFGTALGTGQPFEDARYRDIIIRECGMIVPENELKWYVLRPDDKTFAFERADLLAAFAKQNDMALRGHCLLWHHPRWFPAWLNDYDFGPNPATRAEALLSEHIRAVCARYPQIGSWDVVNEAVNDATGELRETSLSKAMGQGVLEASFHLARQAAPNAKLAYNDYMGWNAGDEKHRAGVLRLLERLKKNGAPVDVFGVQGHLGTGQGDQATGQGPRQEREWRRFIDEAVGMGYDLALTEFDVNDKDLPADPAIRDRIVADEAKAFLDVMLSYPQTKEVLCWGMIDKYTWLQGHQPRPDKLEKRGTPYGSDYRAKPLREAIAAAFRAAPERKPWA
ncbi:endo-1,4-beta-xylanase [Caulobacter sp. NIBR2454]|uniref:endo-1,4-beta-xylanase n=1 Tax=Caulobacter sp. NIBR2454 TaxID=3015996 RepID=UPI0022B65DD6|nr:endo-1,4-beta-xylanase [Caulobacter sp. NIBR2454]